jgi:hypothetical protein
LLLFARIPPLPNGRAARQGGVIVVITQPVARFSRVKSQGPVLSVSGAGVALEAKNP